MKDKAVSYEMRPLEAPSRNHLLDVSSIEREQTASQTPDSTIVRVNGHPNAASKVRLTPILDARTNAKIGSNRSTFSTS